MTPPAPPSPTAWHDVALDKLTRVLGKNRARTLMADTLREADLVSLDSPRDLQRFARILIEAGGFAGAVGGLLSVHAVMYGAEDGSSRMT